MTRIRVCLFLFSFIFSVTTFAQSRNPVSFTLDRATVTSGEPVLLRIHVENKSSKVMDFDLGQDDETKLSIVVTNPSGGHIEKIDHEQVAPIVHHSYSFSHFEPGDDYRVTLVLNEWFDFKQPGHYQIDIQPMEPATMGGEKIPVPLSSLDLEVTSYDRIALETACKRIMEEVIHPGRGGDSLRAAKALELVEDPNLMPFWANLLSETNSDSLGKIAAIHLASNNRDAIQGLAEVLRHARYDKNKKLARNSLQWIVTNTPDPDIKSLAKGALKTR